MKITQLLQENTLTSISAIVLLSFYLITNKMVAQPIVFGANNYIEYQVGSLPIIISVSHGGALQPLNIADRICNDAVFATDVFTIETALEIKNALYATTGCYPHLIICHLKRNKVDCNRNITDGACGNISAETAWNEFHNFIASARTTANQQYNNNTFFVDLHGHGNPIQRIELGYLLYDNELELSDAVLNTNQYLSYSTVKNLALNNFNNYTHAQLLRGSAAFGTLLSDLSYPAVPSQTAPFPGVNTNYYSGGYIVANHTCYAPNLTINGLQMELNYTGIRNNQTNRAQFADAFSQAAIAYLNTHFTMNWNICSLLSNGEINQKDLHIYPNPVQRGNSIKIINLEQKELTFKLFNILGATLQEGKLKEINNEINTTSLVSGLYFVNLFDSQKQFTKVLKLIIE
jgi:hypothetical protein